MYAFIKGIAVDIAPGVLILENGGIGYELAMSDVALSSVEIGSEVTVYTRLIVKDDEISLCGFISEDERTLFDYLVTVSGIGKKSALKVLSTAGSDKIVRWVVSEDHSSLTKLPGIGKKTAERLVVELRDVFKKAYGDLGEDGSFVTVSDIESPVNDDIILALTGLGFSRTEISSMCSGMPEGLDVEGAIKYALKKRNR